MKEILRGNLRIPAVILLAGIFIFNPLVTVEVHTAEETGEIFIDWDEGVLYVEGFGVPPEDAEGDQARLLAQRAAKVDAYRNAAEYLDGVNVTSQTKVEDYVVEDDRIATEVEAYIEGAAVVEREFKDDTSRVQMVLPVERESESLTGFFETEARDAVEDEPETDRDEYEDIIEEVVEEEEREKIERDEYTGVIIDTRGLNVQTALYPQIFDSQGHLLYGPTTVGIEDPDDSSTLVAYSRSREKAHEMDRVGENPAVLEATSVIEDEDRDPVDITLNEENAGHFLEIDDNSSIVKDRAIVFVID